MKRYPLNFKTYDGWISAGYHVIRGQRSSRRNGRGQAIFGFNQVAPLPSIETEFGSVLIPYFGEGIESLPVP